MMKLIPVLALALLAACDRQKSPGAPPPPPPGPAKPRPEKLPNGEPAVITVKHVLISFQGAGGTEATRSKEEAERLAMELIEKAKAAKDEKGFDELMKEHSDDPGSKAGGSYTLVNEGVDPEAGEYRRSGMVRAFGDVGFRIKVGEIGFAPHDAVASPFGYHIILRTK